VPLLAYLRNFQCYHPTAVALVHHARKGAAHERGGQALRGLFPTLGEPIEDSITFDLTFLLWAHGRSSSAGRGRLGVADPHLHR
jgi:hypothetical protein